MNVRSFAFGSWLAVVVLALGMIRASADPVDAAKLIEAVFAQDLKALEQAIAQGADVNAQDPSSGSTALMLACSYGFHDMAELLLSNGADPDVQDNRGMTALMGAVQASRETTELLLDQGADPSIRQETGLTAFTYSVIGVMRSAVPIDVPARLLDRGADVNEAATSGRATGYTPLMTAARGGHAELVGFLIDRGADAGARAADGSTPLRLARSGGHEDIATLLERHGARE